MKAACSPSNLGEEPVWPLAYAELPSLIEHEDTKAKRGWKEPVLNIYGPGANSGLEGGDVVEDECDDDREDHGGEDGPVLVSY